MLSILLLGALPTVVMSCVTNLVYAYGMYRYVLLMGLATNVPRVILYNLLVPLYQGLGAALVFTIGSFSGFATSLIIAHRIGFKLGLHTVTTAYLIPFAIAGTLYIIHAPWYVTAIATLVACAVAYPRLGIIKKDNLRGIGYVLIGRDKTMQLYSILKPIIDALFRE